MVRTDVEALEPRTASLRESPGDRIIEGRHIRLGRETTRDNGLVRHDYERETGSVKSSASAHRPPAQNDLRCIGEQIHILDKDPVAIEEHGRPRRTEVRPRLHAGRTTL